MNNDESAFVLLRDDERLRLVDWPELAQTESLSVNRKSCLVLAAGFEDRSLTALSTICRSSHEFHVCLIRYLPFLEQNRESQIVTMCRDAGASVEILEYDREQPAGIGADIAQSLESCDEVYIDISAMSTAIDCSNDCWSHGSSTNYSDSIHRGRYLIHQRSRSSWMEFPTEGPAPTFLSSGILEVVSTPELSSVSMMGHPIRLVSFPSFDKTQLSNLVQEIQPTHNDVVHGVPPSGHLSWAKRSD